VGGAVCSEQYHFAHRCGRETRSMVPFTQIGKEKPGKRTPGWNRTAVLSLRMNKVEKKKMNREVLDGVRVFFFGGWAGHEVCLKERDL